MSAFLFIPTTADPRFGRRVDFANIASLFAEVEDVPARRPKPRTARIGLLCLLLLGALGDMLLVARPDALAASFSAGPSAQAPHRIASL